MCYIRHPYGSLKQNNRPSFATIIGLQYILMFETCYMFRLSHRNRARVSEA